MTKIIETLLIVLTIGLALTLTYYQINRIEGAGSVLMGVYGSLFLLTLYYLTDFNNRYSFLIQLAMLVGLVSFVFHIQHWPGGFLFSLTNISMIVCSSFCLMTKEVDSKPKQDKNLLNAIGVSLFVYSAFTLTDIQIIRTIGTFFALLFVPLTLTYFIIRKDKSFTFDNNLKTSLVYLTVLSISSFRNLWTNLF
jgi:hypothetical protein